MVMVVDRLGIQVWGGRKMGLGGREMGWRRKRGSCHRLTRRRRRRILG